MLLSGVVLVRALLKGGVLVRALLSGPVLIGVVLSAPVLIRAGRHGSSVAAGLPGAIGEPWRDAGGVSGPPRAYLTALKAAMLRERPR
jgi:hypothetical protein